MNSINIVLKFISLPEKDQEKANKEYKDSTSKAEQAEHKSNLEYLSKIKAKISAIEAHPEGEENACDAEIYSTLYEGHR